MKLRLEVRRPNLPPVKLLWTTTGLRPGVQSAKHQTSVANLLEQVTEVIPLEVAACGLEDYVVESQGYECLHFAILEEIVEENAEVTIRALEPVDRRRRRISLREQISVDGRHLIDGVAFGRPFIQPNGAVAIPDSDLDEVDQRSTQLMIELPEEEDDDDEEEGSDYEYPGSGDDEDNGEDQAGFAKDTMTQEADIHRTASRQKRKRSEGLGIGGAGFSSPLNGGGTPEEALQLPKKRRRSARLGFGDRNSPHSSARSVRFAKEDQETPATILQMMLSEDTSADSGVDLEQAEDSLSLSSLWESDKENRLPRPNLSFDTDLDSDDTSSSGSSGTESSSESERSGRESEANHNHSPCSESSNISYSSEALDGNLGSSDSSEISRASSHDSMELPEDSLTKSKQPETLGSHGSQTVSGLLPAFEPQKYNQKVSDKDEIGKSVPPGAGKPETKQRNNRRKLRNRLERVRDAGLLPLGATLQDYRDWSHNQSEAEINDAIHAALEEKRQSLLSSIAAGGIDATLEISGGEEIQKPPGVAQTLTDINVAERDESSLIVGTASSDRANSDPAVSKRMLLGSFGIESPRKREDEEKIKTKLMENIRPIVKRPKRDLEDVHARPTNISQDDWWKDKVSLAAVECCGRPKRLPTPPFPFVQRWHQKGRKSGGWHEARSSFPTYGNEEMEIELDYGDDPSQADIDRQLLQDTVAAAVLQDLPKIPEDLSSCAALDNQTSVPGAIIAFKQMEMSKSTNWSPIISGFRTAKIKSVDGSLLTLELAKRDQPISDKEFDPETGERIYSGFEAPDLEEGEADEDNPGIIEMMLTELIEPIVITGPEPNKAAGEEIRQGTSMMIEEDNLTDSLAQEQEELRASPLLKDKSQTTGFGSASIVDKTTSTRAASSQQKPTNEDSVSTASSLGRLFSYITRNKSVPILDQE